VSQKNAPGDDALSRLGFDQEELLEKFLAQPGHKAIQDKFDIVFPPLARPKLIEASHLKAETVSELSLDIDLSAGGEELAMSGDKDLDLGGDLLLDDSLSLADSSDEVPSSPLDEGQDFSLGDDDATSVAPQTASEDATSLRIGEDLNLGEDVLAKLAEIDEIMQADATVVRPNLAQSFSLATEEESDEDFSLGEEVSADDLLSSNMPSGGEIDNSAGEFEIAAVDDLFEQEEKPAPKSSKKAPPPTPVAIAVEEEETESFTAAPVASVARSRSTPAEREGFEDVKGHYNSELERLQATLNHLRADREELLKKIDDYEEHKIAHNRSLLNLRAELDEKKIEVQLLKRRLSEEGADLKYQHELEKERRMLAEERARTYQAEAQAMQQKVKLEVKKVSSREKELEQRLELLKSDAETQIRHRDQKILELKRRVDAMEFDMDAMNALEQKNVGDKQELETKLDKAIKTLRTAIGILETDDPKLATLEKLKKNLDV
jgi:hypothetical protein